MASINTTARRFARSAAAPLDGAADSLVNVVIGGFVGNARDGAPRKFPGAQASNLLSSTNSWDLSLVEGLSPRSSKTMQTLRVMFGQFRAAKYVLDQGHDAVAEIFVARHSAVAGGDDRN
jgi:hypothetical protein